MKILVAVLGLTILAYGVLTVAFLLNLPTAVACDRGRTDVEATPHIVGGRFEEHRVGPCVFYNPESRAGD